MSANKTHKRLVKWRIAESNRLESMGRPADPWVIEYRVKNNSIKANWKAKQPPKNTVRVANSGSFKKGMASPNRLTAEQRVQSSIKRQEYQKKWNTLNKDWVNQYKREKRASNPSFKIACNLRKRLSFLVKIYSFQKSKQTLQLLGCTMPEFLAHLESLFLPGMSFDNYGKWHIDHKIPCALFDLTDPSQQAICFHYSNLQPLWALDNLVKNKRIVVV